MNLNWTKTSSESPGKHTIESYFSVKHFEHSERIQRFISLIFKAIFSLDWTLSNPKICRSWEKLFIKESNKQILEITRVSLQGGGDATLLNQNLAQLQKELDQRKIPLDCLNPPRQKNLNDRNEKEIKKYLDYLKDHDAPNYDRVKELWEKDILKITVTELQETLAACTKHLDAKLENEYSIGFVPRKSSKWIAELAFPYLSKLPSSHFEHSTDSLGVVGQQSKLSGKAHQFVIFDDASYSGKQLETVISGMHGQLIKQGKEGKLLLVIPFISAEAEKYLVDNLARKLNAPIGTQAREGSRKLKIQLITSDRPIKNQRTFTEWKVPDDTSLPWHIRGADIKDDMGEETYLEFLTNYPPCYK
jgi:hypothetical protein